MSDDKLKELQDLENETGGKQSGDSGEGPPSGQSSAEEFETRELTPEEIEKFRLKVVKDKTGEIKTSELIQQDLPFGDSKSPGENLEVEGAAADEAALKVTDEIPPPPAAQYPELEKFSAAARPSSSPMTRTLLVVVLALLVIMLYFMFQKDEVPPPAGTTGTGETVQQQPAMVTEDLQTPDGETAAETGGETGMVTPGKVEPPPPVYELSTDEFRGTAPMEVRPEGPVISEAADPEIAAIADALKIRAAAIYGTNINSRAGVTTTVTSGKFQGFNIVNTYQEKGEDVNKEVIKNETVVLTPSRGKILVKENFLDSVRQTDYDQFRKDLEASGLEVIKKDVPEEGIVSVQLRVTQVSEKPVNPEFLIGPDSVGVVKLDMPVDEMKSALSSGNFTVVDKRMLAEDTYYNTFKVLDRWNNPLFFATEKAGKVWGIRVLSEKFQTAKGVGMGDTLDKFRIFYLESGKMTVSVTPGGAPFLSVPGEQARFFLHGEGLDFEKQVFPGDLKVTDILLGGSPFIK